jgi:hypothetical protein
MVQHHMQLPLNDELQTFTEAASARARAELINAMRCMEKGSSGETIEKPKRWLQSFTVRRSAFVGTFRRRVNFFLRL